MAGENCIANTPINHRYWISDYKDAYADPYVMRFTTDNFGLTRVTETVKDDGTGSPWDVKDSEIESRYAVRGPISLTPRPEQMATLLPCMLGNDPALTVYEPAGKICDFFQVGHYDPTVAKVFKYKNLVCGSWAIACSDSASLLKLEMNVEAAERLTAAYVTETLPLSTQKPWVLRQAVVTIGGNVFRVKDIRIAGNNNLSTDDYFNSAYRVEIPSLFQQYTFSHTSPFDTANDLALLDTAANVTGKVVFTSGSNVLTIDFPSLFARPSEPTVGQRQRVLNKIDWTAQYDPATVGQTPIKFTLVTA